MIRRTSLTALMSAVALVAGLGASATAYAQQVTLRVFSGGANQRPDLMRKLFDQYQAKNPNVKVEIETGGATSELQRQYLSTVLNAKDAAIDIYLIDIVNPAQYYGAGWLEPLDAHLGKPADVMKPYWTNTASRSRATGTTCLPRPRRSPPPKATRTCRACRSRAHRSKARSAPSCCPTGARARSSTMRLAR